jgi:glycerol-3-phosphate O-acyltransferase
MGGVVEIGTEPSVPLWPAETGPYVALVDASSKLEADLIATWIVESTELITDPIDVFHLPPSRRQRRFSSVDLAIGERLSREDDPLCVPIRVVWLAKEIDGVRQVRISDMFKPGDPRDPNVFMQRFLLKRHPDRCQMVVGQPARRSDLEKRWTSPIGRGPADGTTFGEFVALQAWKALERAERHVRGLRYKVPKFLREDLFWSRPFQAGIHRLAREEGKSDKRMSQRTGRYLKEIAAIHSPNVIDIVNGITTRVIRAAHRDIDYSESDLRSIYRAAEKDPIVFLPSHKSNFDHLVFQHVLYENELPLNHTAGGINLNFFLIGPLLRRSGIFFIRREFKTNEPYKFVLRQYIDYLLEKRFALEWYIEGGRSRSGKLREPKLGLLAYVADAYQRGITNDVILVPVSIAYDQITDVGSYTDEQRGGKKQQESFSWAVKFIGSLQRQNGRIYVRFGEPLALSERIGRDEDLTSGEGHLALPKIAFEISTRINDVTPITAISLVTLALLSEVNHGLTITETAHRLEPFTAFVDERNLPITDDLPFTSLQGVEAALDALVVSGVVKRSEGLTASVYSIGEGKHLAAAYYRNTIIHFFVNAGITELALGTCFLRGEQMTRESVVARALEIRDLLKFEFFFAPTDDFIRDIESEIERYTVSDPESVDRLGFDMASFHPNSPIVLGPFFEAYFVVAATLMAEASNELTEATLAEKALRMGDQLVSHGDISNKEAVSSALFATGTKLALSRGLLGGTLDERTEFYQELEEILETLDAIRMLKTS